MREYSGELAGKSLTLAATFGASVKIAKSVGDPMMIAREANVEAYMLDKGLNYNPRWTFDVENVPELIHIGLKEAGSSMTLKEVQELVFEVGFAAARDFALEYLALIIGPAPEHSGESDGKTEGN